MLDFLNLLLRIKEEQQPNTGHTRIHIEWLPHSSLIIVQSQYGGPGTDLPYLITIAYLVKVLVQVSAYDMIKFNLKTEHWNSLTYRHIRWHTNDCLKTENNIDACNSMEDGALKDKTQYDRNKIIKIITYMPITRLISLGQQARAGKNYGNTILICTR